MLYLEWTIGHFQVHLWDMEDVQSWLTIAGFRGFQAAFQASTVDGEMLLLLTENELKNDLRMLNNVHRKRCGIYPFKLYNMWNSFLSSLVYLVTTGTGIYVAYSWWNQRWSVMK